MRAQSPVGSATGCDSGTVLLRPCTAPPPARAAADPGGERRVGAQLDQRVRPAPSRRRSRRHRGRRRGPSSERPAPRPGPATRPAPGRAARRRGRRRAVDAERVARGLDDGLPARAPAQVGPQGRLDVAARRRPRRARRLERGQAHHDARRAEAALAGPVCDEGGGPAVAQLGRRSLEGGDLTSRDAADRRDAGDAGRAVDPHRAAPALALRAAAVLDGAAAELLAQRVEEADPVLDRDGVAVEDEGDAGHGRARRGAAGMLGSGAGSAQGAGCRRAGLS